MARKASRRKRAGARHGLFFPGAVSVPPLNPDEVQCLATALNVSELQFKAMRLADRRSIVDALHYSIQSYVSALSVPPTEREVADKLAEIASRADDFAYWVLPLSLQRILGSAEGIARVEILAMITDAARAARALSKTATERRDLLERRVGKARGGRKPVQTISFLMTCLLFCEEVQIGTSLPHEKATRTTPALRFCRACLCLAAKRLPASADPEAKRFLNLSSKQFIVRLMEARKEMAKLRAN
jgi:hypothetical protein